MPNKIEKVIKFWSDFQGSRLSRDDELDLYAWRRTLPKEERAYRNHSSRRKLFIMISKFVDELIWREQLMKTLRNGELAKQLWARIEKKISNTAS